MASPKQAETDEQKRATGVGALLKASRLRVGDDLHDIASILKIRYVYLEAIEDGRFEDLPGHTYSMGFVRAYAEHLGLDSEEVIRRFKAQVVGDRSEKSLEFPEPIPEMGIPGGAIIFIGILVAAVAYGVWYVNTSKNGFMAELIAPVPARLAEQGVGGNPPKPAAPEVAAKTEPMSKPEPGPEPEPEPEPVMPVAAAAPMSETASPPVPSQPREAPVAATAAAPMPEADPAPSPAPTAAPVVEKPAPVETVPTPEPAPVPEPAPAKTVAAPQPAPTPAPEPAPTPKAAKPVVPVETPSAPSVASADAPSVVSADAPSVVPVDMIPPAASATGSASAPGISTPKTPISQSAPEAQTAALPKAAPKTETTPAPSSGKSRIIVRAKMNSWIQVRDDAVNELLLTRLLRAGDSYAVPDRSGLKLSTGNAGALEILVDGKAVPAIGSEGTVRRNVALDADKLMAGTAANE